MGYTIFHYHVCGISPVYGPAAHTPAGRSFISYHSFYCFGLRGIGKTDLY